MGAVVSNTVDCLLDSGIDAESHEGLLLGLVADLGGKDRVTQQIILKIHYRVLAQSPVSLSVWNTIIWREREREFLNDNRNCLCYLVILL